MMKKLLLLVLIVGLLLGLVGCNDPIKKVKKEVREAKEDLSKAGEFVQELRNRDDCLHTALTEGKASDACPGAGD